MIARELTEFFAGFSPDGGPALLERAGDPPFLSNVNACYRRDCWEEIRFDDVALRRGPGVRRARCWPRAGRRPTTPARPCCTRTTTRPLELHAPLLRRVPRAARDERARRAARRALDVRDVRGLVAADRRWMREQGVPARGARALDRRARRVHHAGAQARLARSARARTGCPPAVAARDLARGPRAAPAPAAGAGRGAPVRRPRGRRRLPGDVARLGARGRGAAAPTRCPGMADRERLHIAVVIPPFRRGSGGHSHDLQARSRGSSERGHTCSIWIARPARAATPAGWPAVLRAQSCDEYFAPARARPCYKGFDDWHGADVVVATGWDTVYPVLLLAGCRARAYLVQDHEPEFFATSAESQLGRAHLRPRPLPRSPASPWLRDLVQRAATARDGTCVPLRRRPRRLPPARRRAPARHGHLLRARRSRARRAVPLGAARAGRAAPAPARPALRALRRRRSRDTPFPYEHLGVASPEAARAALLGGAPSALCLSLTNYSLIPQEMLACGLPCVDLAGGSPEACSARTGRWSSREADPVALADALERLLDDERPLAPALGGRARVRARRRTWEHAAARWSRACAAPSPGARQRCSLSRRSGRSRAAGRTAPCTAASATSTAPTGRPKRRPAPIAAAGHASAA